MAEELGKIEKPNVEDYKLGRKIYFVPLVFSSQKLPQEYGDKNSRYWEQVEAQLGSLEDKLGKTEYIFHELVPESGERGLQTIKQLKVSSLDIVEKRVGAGAKLESTEDDDILAELMDWSRCLSIGLQSQKVYSTIYAAYTEANNKRNESIAQKIDQTIKANQSAIIIMGEGHHVRFPADIRIFYIAPPALDDLKRWLRDYEAHTKDNFEDPSEPTDNTASETQGK
jgi:hypothetical protein